MTSIADTTPHRVEFHADALDANGRTLPDRVWGWEMPVLADLRTLDDARNWAAATLERDDRAAAVSIRETIQPFPGSCWKMGRHVETITREPEGEDVYYGDGSGWTGYSTGE